jgi:hypothetical protein
VLNYELIDEPKNLRVAFIKPKRTGKLGLKGSGRREMIGPRRVLGGVRFIGCEQEFARGGDLGDFRGAGNFGTLVSCIKMGAEWKNET